MDFRRLYTVTFDSTAEVDFDPFVCSANMPHAFLWELGCCITVVENVV